MYIFLFLFYFLLCVLFYMLRSSFSLMYVSHLVQEQYYEKNNILLCISYGEHSCVLEMMFFASIYI